MTFTLGLVGVTAASFQALEATYKTTIGAITSVPSSNVNVATYVEKQLTRRLLQATILSVQTELFGIDITAAAKATESLLAAKTDGSLLTKLAAVKAGLDIVMIATPTTTTGATPTSCCSSPTCSTSCCSTCASTTAAALRTTPSGLSTPLMTTATYDASPSYPWSSCCQAPISDCCPYKPTTVDCCYPNWSSCCPYNQQVYNSCGGNPYNQQAYNNCGGNQPMVSYYDSPGYLTSSWYLQNSAKSKVGELINMAHSIKEQQI